MTDQLPAIIPPGALTTPTDTYIVPALIADLGEQATWSYVEFFTANINNDHTRPGETASVFSGRSCLPRADGAGP